MESVLETSELTGNARVFSAKRGVGSFLTFDFICNPRRSIHEDYHLWIYLTDWVIKKNGMQILDSEAEDDDDYKLQLERFIGKKLVGFLIDKGNIRFLFEENLEIELFSDVEFYEDTDELFMFFDRTNKTVTSFSPAQKLSSEAIE